MTLHGTATSTGRGRFTEDVSCPRIGAPAAARLRQFNTNGISRFRQWLESAREDGSIEPPWELLTADDAAEPVEPAVNVERRSFSTKLEAAQYLHRVLMPVPADSLLRNRGLWTWLALFYFDGVCPAHQGRRKVKNDYHYIYEADQALYHYRHLLRISYEVMRRAPHHNRLFLNSPLSKLGSITERVMRRLYLTRVDAIFEVMDRLYFDESRGKAKRNIADPRSRPGDLTNRLPLRIRQLQRTYDLNVVKADRLLELLGPEFQRWLDGPELPGLEISESTG